MAKADFSQRPSLKSLLAAAGLTILISLQLATTAGTVTADTGEPKWSRVNIPTEGEVGDWVLADGSDVQHLTMAADGTLYAYGKGLTRTLYRSTDGGESWSYLSDVQDSIVDIAIAPDSSGTLYYATASAVYRSTDGGKSFTQLGISPGGAGSGNVTITDIDVASPESNIIVAGTRDTDSG
ncbi:MAG: WD40/YVTN/BNR-like repeat-containing protein, partial [Planctomycetota bacterium]